MSTEHAAQPTPAENFNTIEAAIADIQAGKCVIVTDDEDRENEGDLVFAADKVSPELVNFLIKEARGLICVPMLPGRLQQLGIPAMVAENREAHRTAFTVSVDATAGITTGISAADRAHTIALLAKASTPAEAFVQPGHIFPLRANPGGVLQRAGHTEAAVDLAKLAGCAPVGVICEILNDDGSMARLPHLVDFKAKHGLKMVCIRDLIKYREQRECLVEQVEAVHMPTDFGDFTLHGFRSQVDGAEHLAMVKGQLNAHTPTLVRVHSECFTGDVLGSQRCDCRWQLHEALKAIETEGTGVVLYMRQEGRGIGLMNKLHAYKLQEAGYDTVEANQKLGFAPDLRTYGIGAQILSKLGLRKLKLMTNNPRKIVGLEAYNLEITTRVPIKAPACKHRSNYISTKETKLGHMGAGA